MTLGLSYICDVPQGSGSGRRLFVTRFTGASVSSVKAVRPLLHNVTDSDDLIGHSQILGMTCHCARNVDTVFQTIFRTAAAILRKWAGYETTSSVTPLCYLSSQVNMIA